MTDTPWPLAELEIIGGHCCPRPPAPFARGPAVVRRLDDPERIRIAYRLDPRGASGGLLTPSQWRGLVGSFNALELPKPAPARAHTALWVFTSCFGVTHGECLEDLRQRSAWVAEFRPRTAAVQPAEGEGPDASLLVLVDESRAGSLRSEWRATAYNHAWKLLQDGDSPGAERHAERAFALQSEPDPADIAVLAIIYSRNNRRARSDGLLSAARNSYSPEFNQRILESYTRMLSELPPARPAAASAGAQTTSIAQVASARLRLVSASQKGLSK